MSDKVIAAFPFSDASRTPEKAASERKLAELMIASVRRSMPDVEIWQITDLKHTEALPVDHVFRKPFIYDNWVPWMFDCLAQIPGKVLFLDSDIIVQRDLRPLFNTGADVTLTSRGPKVINGRNMPFLLGVVASKVPTFWLDARDRVLAMPNEDDRNWWGSQTVLLEMWEDMQQGRLPWKIAAVSVDPHNYVPKHADDAPADKWVLHYKGPKRKAWMLERFGRVACTRCPQGRACWHVDCPHHEQEARAAA
jgi:hypothetical protein